MSSAPRFARCLLVAATLSVSLVAPAGRSASVPTPEIDGITAAPETSPLAGIRPEGRLRKLHLVRPDLIPYPIAYEVYC